MESRTAPTLPLIKIRSSATVGEAAQMISDLSIGALGVVDEDGIFVGIFTERDLAWVVARGLDCKEATIAETLNDFPVIIDGPIGVERAIEEMVAAHVRHLLVRNGSEMRIVSARDLLRETLADKKIRAHIVSESEMRHWTNDGAAS